MIPCLAGALLACVFQQPLDPVLRELVYLGHHQGADGLWGKRPPGCRCLVPRAWPEGRAGADDATKAAVAAAIERLSEPDIAARVAAEKDLLRLGLPAVPQLREGASGADAEAAARFRDVLDRLGRGLEESDAGLTGLALLAFMGAGYSHLSRDEFEGLCFGAIVWRGLEALRARQAQDGVFDSRDALANVWAAIAMSEAYGLTGSVLWKEPAEKGLGPVERAVAKDERHAVWKALAVRSGMAGEAWKAGEEPARALFRRLAGMEGMQAQAGALILEAWLDRRRGGPRAGALTGIDPWTLGDEDLFLCTAGIRSGWRASEEPAKAWMEKLNGRKVRGRGVTTCGLELSPGLRRSAFRTLTLEACYRYGSSLGEAWGIDPFER